MKKFIMELIIIKLFLAILVQKCVTQETSSTDLSSSTLPTTTSIPILYLNGNNITWNPSSTQEVQIECDLGYKITATIVECRIDGVNLGYARISSGRETENLMFTYNVTNKPSYFFNTNKLNAAFSGTGTMTVIFSRVADKPSYQFEDRMTQISLPPHYLQETPALFESTYSMFNPAVGSTNPGFERYEDDFEDNKNDDLESESSIIEESGA
ncbi:unnamed protein product [Psylliodes chrysocephalus]|uniref:Uncharacterized protein n=1 Tax=Psylliodes chrysocephalus TaxID=3402493 RepID=A0A9P0CIW1_9CUCU|nr:unnamed protein product [Psylliodes chrysocephala]